MSSAANLFSAIRVKYKSLHIFAIVINCLFEPTRPTLPYRVPYRAQTKKNQKKNTKKRKLTALIRLHECADRSRYMYIPVFFYVLHPFCLRYPG